MDGEGEYGIARVSIVEGNLLDVSDPLLAEVLQHRREVGGADPEVVLDLLYGLPPVRVADQHSPAGGVRAGPHSSAEMPGVADHQLEVVVVVDPRREVGVVVGELLVGHHLVAVLVPALHELLQRLDRGLLLGKHIGVLGDVVQGLQLIQGDQVVAVGVQQGVGLVHQGLPPVIGRSPQRALQLRHANLPAAVAVKEGHQLVHLSGGEPQAVGLQAGLQLELVQQAVAVVVHDPQHPYQPPDAVPPAALVGKHPHLVHRGEPTARQLRRLQSRVSRCRPRQSQVRSREGRVEVRRGGLVVRLGLRRVSRVAQQGAGQCEALLALRVDHVVVPAVGGVRAVAGLQLGGDGRWRRFPGNLEGLCSWRKRLPRLVGAQRRAM
eukprot:RCo043382